MAENTFAMTSTHGTGSTSSTIPTRGLSTGAPRFGAAGWPSIIPAGRPLPNLSLRLVDEAGQPVGEATVGEVLIQ